MRKPGEAIAGCLLGCAVGDAIGLPYEGMSPLRSRRFARTPVRHRFLPGYGMVSDDTDHTVFVAQSLIVAGCDPIAFRRSLAWRLRWWFVCLPAGIGWATLRSILRMWLGFPRPGVWSAGNGPSMRSAIIGSALSGDATLRRQFVEESTQLTHTDPLALAGALAVAEVAARIASGSWNARPSPQELSAVLRTCLDDPHWQDAVSAIERACASDAPLEGIAMAYGGRAGVSGFVLHSVPFALIAWHRHFGDFRATLEAVIRAGGDVDTVGAIAGALCGTGCGPQGIPGDWLDGIVDWPHSTRYLRRLAAHLEDPAQPVSTAFSPFLFVRGVLFTWIVLLHGFRRLLPPY